MAFPIAWILNELGQKMYAWASTKSVMDFDRGGENGQTLQKTLNDLFSSVSEGKSLIAAAVTEKGVETAADSTFQEMADNIQLIKTGSPKANVTFEDTGFFNKIYYMQDGIVQEAYNLSGINQIDAESILIITNLTDAQYYGGLEVTGNVEELEFFMIFGGNKYALCYRIYGDCNFRIPSGSGGGSDN